MAGLSEARGGLFAGGNIALLVFSMLTVQYPEGNPGKAREAGAVWAGLMADVTEWGKYGDDAARAIVTNNAGEDVQAFKDFWQRHATPAAPAEGEAARLAELCRRMSEACNEYASLIEKAQYAFTTLAWANFASLLFISTFPWQAGVAYEISQFLLRRAQAGILAKLLESAIAQTLLAKLAEYTIGSAFYAVGDVLVMDGVKWARGEDVGSFGQNFDEVMKEFVASVAFYGAFDAAAKPVSKIISNPDVQYFVNRMVGGSLGYGPTYGYLNGKRGDDLAPTVKDTILRTILYTTMAHKPAG
ncbi:hypothetical protein GCM10023196_076070 [Actinoallomurus vinaceus]|uniref:Outer membrane channel protein CpnT-like N-terminal domain-containing protein n=1 Tax=Actinoallomurus vinaceus TaxID=1080074 RepID=A0ABP8ULL0_9ACTN